MNRFGWSTFLTTALFLDLSPKHMISFSNYNPCSALAPHHVTLVSRFRRKQIEHLEQEHVLAEAQRLAQLAEQEANRVELEEQTEELQQLKSEAEHMKIKAEKVRACVCVCVCVSVCVCVCARYELRKIGISRIIALSQFLVSCLFW